MRLVKLTCQEDIDKLSNNEISDLLGLFISETKKRYGKIGLASFFANWVSVTLKEIDQELEHEKH